MKGVSVNSTATAREFLLVEDETLIRMMLFDMIEELEHHVVREAGNLDEAHPARGMRRSNFRLKPGPPVK